MLSRCVSKLLSHLPKTLNFTYAFKCYQNNVTSKNVSWPHFSWATMYITRVTTKRKRISDRAGIAGKH